MQFYADLFQDCHKAAIKCLLFHRVSVNNMRFVRNDKMYKEDYDLIVSDSF